MNLQSFKIFEIKIRTSSKFQLLSFYTTESLRLVGFWLKKTPWELEYLDPKMIIIHILTSQHGDTYNNL